MGQQLDVPVSIPVSVGQVGGTPSTQAFGDAPNPGSAPTVARSDHKHGMPSASLPQNSTLASEFTTSSAVSVDTGLSVTLLANHAYVIDAIVILKTNAGGTASVYDAFTGTAFALMGSALSPNGTFDGTKQAVGAIGGTIATTFVYCYIRLIVNVNTSGAYKIQVANDGTRTTTVSTSSILTATQIK
jgi:hypothetical protein